MFNQNELVIIEEAKKYFNQLVNEEEKKFFIDMFNKTFKTVKVCINFRRIDKTITGNCEVPNFYLQEINKIKED